MTDPVEYINLERLRDIRFSPKNTSVNELLDVLEYDIRRLTEKSGIGFDPDDVQQLLDIHRAIKYRLSQPKTAKYVRKKDRE